MKNIKRCTQTGGLFILLLSQSSCHNVLGFSTSTKFGLDISQRADQMIDVSMGYDRTEVASIPAPDQDGSMDATASPGNSCSDNSGCSDVYSVLGTFEVNYGIPFSLDPEPLEIHQLFATGMAARVAAKNPEIQTILGNKAKQYASEGLLDKPGVAIQSQSSKGENP